jgi:hypothetical protein
LKNESKKNLYYLHQKKKVWNKLLLGPAYFFTKKISLIVSQLNSDVTVTAVLQPL